MPDEPRSDRFPGYDVLRKRHGPSWNDKTRVVIGERLIVPRTPRFFTAPEFETVEALAMRIVPQPASRPAIPVAALVDEKLFKGHEDGYRRDGVPRDGDAWRVGLAALDAEAEAAHGKPVRALGPGEQDGLIAAMRDDRLTHERWGAMSARHFFEQRCGRDIVIAYYAHPSAWNEIGWGGPASPRGYVRMGVNERDPWEAAEVRDGNVEAAMRRNRRVG